MSYALLVIQNKTADGVYPYYPFIIVPAYIWNFMKDEYMKVEVYYPKDTLLGSSDAIKVDWLTDAAVVMQLGFEPVTNWEEEVGEVRILRSSDGSYWEKVIGYPLMVMPLKTVYKLTLGSTSRTRAEVKVVRAEALKSFEPKFIKKTYSVREMSSSEALLCFIYCEAPYTKPSTTLTEAPKYGAILPVYAQRGTEIYVPIPSKYEIFGRSVNHYVELIYVKDGEPLAYYFNDLKGFEQDAEAGQIVIEPTLYRHKIKVQVEPSDVTWFVNNLTPNAIITNVNTDTGEVEFESVTGIGGLPLLAWIAILCGVIGGTASFIAWSWSRVEATKEETKKKEIEKEIIDKIFKAQTEQVKVITAQLPPELAARTLSVMYRTHLSYKPYKEENESLKATLETLKNIIMWVVIGAMVLVVLRWFLR